MSSSSYRIYVRYEESNCLRFFAPGDGTVATDGLQLFEWIRDPRNVKRLRNGLQHVYEIDQEELQHFLEVKLREDRMYMKEQIKKYSGGGDMLAAFGRKRVEFSSLQTGVDMLEAISNATETTVIPRTSPRKRSDQEMLEVYEFKNYKPHKSSPFARLTIKSLYRESPKKPPGYYIKLKLSELESMWRTEWITLHEIHAETLDRLWKRNATVFQTIPHADTIPFAVLYGNISHGQHENGMNLSRSRRPTPARLKEVLGALNRRQPSKVPIFESERSQPRSVVDNHMDEWQARMFRLRGGKVDRQRRRAYRG
ncbi:hypothetical protein CHU98_g6904 [Xylaria longipes]|nr:hypothetical protein CHU98_g6904 [Xylaria longipes]